MLVIFLGPKDMAVLCKLFCTFGPLSGIFNSNKSNSFLSTGRERERKHQCMHFARKSVCVLGPKPNSRKRISAVASPHGQNFAGTIVN